MKKYLLRYGFSLLIALIFLSISLLVLYKSRPNEDAFILFKYVENFASGFGISFYKGGPPTEGATDFLWLILLSILRLAGIDVAISSAIFNSLGMFLICLIITSQINKLKQNLFLKVSLYIVVPLLLFLPFSLAGYVGYSATLYSALILIAFYLFLEEHRFLHLLPYLALIISLFRPDGVIISVGYVLLVYLKLKKEINLKKFILNIAVSVLIGLVYFIWRWIYFDSFLPLPLYVKSNSAGYFNGLSWVIDYAPVFSVFIFFYLLKNEQLKKKFLLLLGLLPLCFHILSLSFALHLQNDFGRFQAPFVLVLYFSLIIVLIQNSNVIKSYKQIIIIPLFLLSFSSGFIQARFLLDAIKQRGFEYIDLFAYELKDLTDENNVIALTEAGRLPFWSNSNIIDLNGLNNKYTSQHIPNSNYLQSCNPDIVLYDGWGILNLSQFKCSKEKIIDITGYDIRNLLIPEYKKYLPDKYIKYEEVNLNNIKMAAIKATEFISINRNDYITFLVWYDIDFNHVISFKKNLKNLDEIINTLFKTVYSQEKKSYIMMISKSK